MNDAKSYAAPVALGAVMVGGTVSRVVESKDPALAPGDLVLSYAGWQDYAVAPAAAVRKLDPTLAPVSTALGVLGMPGHTAYAGLYGVGQPKPGETVVVAAASGAVGSLVGQLARLKGARAVGIAGGAEKCAHVVRDLGFDACLDHRSPDFAAELAAACPAGIDVYFENVGGAVWDAVFPLLNPFGRVPVCGVIAWYSGTGSTVGRLTVPEMMRSLLTRHLTIRGFIVSDFASLQDEFHRTVAAGLRDGTLRYREDIVDGLEQAPSAFVGLLKGRNFGKLLIRVAPERV